MSTDYRLFERKDGESVRRKGVEVMDGFVSIYTKRGVVLLDLQDYDRMVGSVYVSESNGRLSAELVVNDNVKSYHCKLARFVLSAAAGFVVDHINHDTLDNRRANLRVCTVQENKMNCIGHNHRKGKYKGIYPCGKKNGSVAWVAQVTRMKKKYYLGTFYTQEEARDAYNRHAPRIHGEFFCPSGEKQADVVPPGKVLTPC
jgi:hypothetical protein